MNNLFKILFISFLTFACSKQKHKSKTNEDNKTAKENTTLKYNQANQTDALSYCNKDIFLGALKINVGCNDINNLTYLLSDIKKSFNLPIIKEVDKPADENTGGSERFMDILFQDNLGQLKISIYDFKLPEFYLTNKRVPLKIGEKAIYVGDSAVKLKKLLSYLGGFKETKEKSIYILLDYSTIEFGINDKNSINYIAFNGNYFY